MISTMEMINIVVLTVVGVILATQGNVEACSCFMPGNFTDKVCNKEIVALVSVLSEELDDGDGELYYVVNVVESYMGGPAMGSIKAYRLTDPPSPCEGRTMDLGENYVFTGFSYEKEGKSHIKYNTCSYVQAWEEILNDSDYESMYATLKALDTEC